MCLGLAWNTAYLDVAASRLTELCGRAEVKIGKYEKRQPSSKQETRVVWCFRSARQACDHQVGFLPCSCGVLLLLLFLLSSSYHEVSSFPGPGVLMPGSDEWRHNILVSFLLSWLQRPGHVSDTFFPSFKISRFWTVPEQLDVLLIFCVDILWLGCKNFKICDTPGSLVETWSMFVKT